MRQKQAIKFGFLVVLVGMLAGVVLQRQAIMDWFRLRGYHAPSSVMQLADETTLTPKARNLFYVNHPDITTGKNFTSHCPSGGEKTVVLGCYIGTDAGIYLYSVTDSRLAGVEQVTAAHETLHAAYRRLSSSQKKEVDGWLTDYYEHSLTDPRVKATIQAYQQSEPNDVVNEMHSVFGTEVANLPAPLENYYKQYFTDRSKITAYTAQYQAEFTGRQYAVAAYDTLLHSLKQQVDTNQASLNQQKANLDARNQQMQNEKANDQIAAYNASVAGYNAAVGEYNTLVATTKSLIDQYNQTVTKRNAVVLEEQQLVQAISADSVQMQ